MSKRTYYTKSNKIVSVDFSKMSTLISSSFTRLNLNDFLIIDRVKLVEAIVGDKIVSEHVGMFSLKSSLKSSCNASLKVPFKGKTFKNINLGHFCKEFLVKDITINSDDSIENMPITISSSPSSWMIVFEIA